jgi:8-oxo-dGTP pyrophosphatase MutT (NUDIX family)
MFIPADRLPPGFVERLDVPSAGAVEARPAATLVLLRDTTVGPEVLLLRRTRSAGFVPGAYVFAGGRVDQGDTDPRLWQHLTPPAEPAPEYWSAALRELFEETGVLLARDAAGRFAPDSGDTAIAALREALLADRATLHDVLMELQLRPALDGLVPFAHWITPLAEPRRFDTRFFLAALPEGAHAVPDAREMSDAVWLTPRAALDRFEAGRLPMVFPTVRTLETLVAFTEVAAVLEAFRGRAVTPILPRLVRSEGGVALVVDQPDVAARGGS